MKKWCCRRSDCKNNFFPDGEDRTVASVLKTVVLTSVGGGGFLLEFLGRGFPLRRGFRDEIPLWKTTVEEGDFWLHAEFREREGDVLWAVARRR